MMMSFILAFAIIFIRGSEIFLSVMRWVTCFIGKQALIVEVSICSERIITQTFVDSGKNEALNSAISGLL